MTGLSRPVLETAGVGGLAIARQRHFLEREFGREQGILKNTRRP